MLCRTRQAVECTVTVTTVTPCHRNPQFLQGSKTLAPQLLVLVPSALAITVLVYGGYCALGHGVGRLLSSARRRRLFHRGIGGFYLFSALGLAWFDPRRS